MKMLFAGGLFGMLLAIGGWIGGELVADSPLEARDLTELKELIERISRLEMKVKMLETQLTTPIPASKNRPELPVPGDPDDEWKARATGHRVVNGSRVFFLPLSQTRPKTAPSQIP